MESIAQHPMDRIPVRALAFDLDNIEKRDFVWSRSCPEFAVFINALGVHVPYFERYLISAMRKAKPEMRDEGLVRDMSGIIGQEAHHAKNFIHLNRLLAEKYPKVAKFDADAKQYFSTHANSDTLKQLVGFTAGYETFTFLAGLIVLDNYQKWFSDSDPVMKALWVWHQVEEVEHGSVAFNVYQHLYGDDELYRKWMVVHALAHIGFETVKAYVHMARVEGWLRNPFKAVSCMTFCASMLLRLVKNALPVFRKNYHPRNHPKVTNNQNRVQIAWRRYENNGGDVLAINHGKMAKIMNLNT